MKLSPVDIYGTIMPENAPVEIFYYYAKVLGKNETHSKNATFLQVLQWSYQAPVIPDRHTDWSEQDFELFARFINPEVMTWTVAQLVTAWKFIKDVNENKVSFNSKIPYGFPTPKQPKSLSPLLCYSICSRMYPLINMRGRSMDELYTVSRAMLFSGSITGLVETIQQSIYLSLATTNDIEPILGLMETFDQNTKILTRNLKKRMNAGDRFHFVRAHMNDDINNRLLNGFYSLRESNGVVQDIQEEEEIVEEVNPTTFYTEEVEDPTRFQYNTNLPIFAMSIIGANLNDFEFGDTYAICLRNRQVLAEFEFGRERICAIVKAAYYHNRDITEADFPEQVREFDLEEYPLLTDDFNPDIPPKAYRKNTLAELALNEGIIERLRTGYNEYELHELLQVNMLEPKFWLGFCHPAANKDTIYLEPVEEVANPISFGVRGGPYYIFDPDELAECFNTNGTLQNPAAEKLEYFSPTAIRQLLQIIEEGELKTAIQTIVDKLGSLEMKIQEFYRLFQKKEEYKEQITNLVKALHDVAMYTRGWSGVGPLPIEEATFDDYNLVEEKSNMAIGKYMAILEHCDDEVKECFPDLPIWKFSRGQYLRPNHEANTIHKRLQLVLLGEQNSDENSCIRLSSNYFAGTSYRLAKTIGLDLGYNIEDIREIS